MSNKIIRLKLNAWKYCAYERMNSINFTVDEYFNAFFTVEEAATFFKLNFWMNIHNNN